MRLFGVGLEKLVIQMETKSNKKRLKRNLGTLAAPFLVRAMMR
jgi:hypothetical protein